MLYSYAIIALIIISHFVLTYSFMIKIIFKKFYKHKYDFSMPSIFILCMHLSFYSMLSIFKGASVTLFLLVDFSSHLCSVSIYIKITYPSFIFYGICFLLCPCMVLLQYLLIQYYWLMSSM